MHTRREYTYISYLAILSRRKRVVLEFRSEFLFFIFSHQSWGEFDLLLVSQKLPLEAYKWSFHFST